MQVPALTPTRPRLACPSPSPHPAAGPRARLCPLVWASFLGGLCCLVRH